MKKLFIVLSLALSWIEATAWDLIITRESEKIECRVEEVSETHIKYRKASNPQGPLFTLEVKDVATVIYENGEVQAFEEQPEPQQVQQPQNQYGSQPMTYEAYQLQRMQEREQLMKAREEAKEQRKEAKLEKKRLHDEKMSQKKVYFQGMFEVDATIGYKAYKSGKDTYSTIPPAVLCPGGGPEFILGFRTQNLINFFGFGFGFHVMAGATDLNKGKYNYFYGYKDGPEPIHVDYDKMNSSNPISFFMLYMPLYVNDRIYLPTKKNVNPFLDLSLGGYFAMGRFGVEYDRELKSEELLNGLGLYSIVGIGMEYKRLVIGAGCKMLSHYFEDINCVAYFKVGVRMGWLSPAKPIIKR